MLCPHVHCPIRYHIIFVITIQGSEGSNWNVSIRICSILRVQEVKYAVCGIQAKHRDS